MLTEPPAYHRSARLDHPLLTHGFFGRQGGVSTGEYSSLNCTFRDDEDEANVRENHRRVLQALKAPENTLITLNQTHSNQVHYVDKKHTNPIALDGDAMVTSTPYLVLGIRTADCLPILLADPTNHVIAAIHAGWRGLHSKIISKTLNLMRDQGAKCEKIQVAIGPHIHQKNYEVDADLHNLFCTEDKDWATFFSEGERGKYMADLAGIATHQLKNENISQVDILPLDTFTNPSHFFSCRGAGKRGENKFGCQLSTIMLEQ